MQNRPTLVHALAWNREQLDRAWRDRHSPNKDKAIAASKDARRFGDNIAKLEEAILWGDTHTRGDA